MSTREPYFSSDWHLLHKGVAQKCNRPWKDEDNIARIIHAQKSVTTIKDTTYHLGDFAFTADYDLMRTIAMSFTGKLKLIPGNHCRTHILQRLADESHGKIELLPHYNEIKLRKKLFCLFHFPIEVWHASHFGAFHLHGHCHGNLSQEGKGLRMDVGIDAHPEHRIFSTEDIFNHMASKKIYDPEGRVERDTPNASCIFKG
jgi:calcineurin-like phosphoesterase family protein